MARLLTEAEYFRTIDDGVQSYEADDYLGDIAVYIKSIALDEFQPKGLDEILVKYVFATLDEKCEEERFEHVLVNTRLRNSFLAIVYDLANNDFYGHYLLNLNDSPTIWSIVARDSTVDALKTLDEWTTATDPLLIGVGMVNHPNVSPSMFRGLFHFVLHHNSGLTCLWQLAIATIAQLERHPGTLHVPESLPIKLLRSNDLNARVIGLKLFVRYCDTSISNKVDEIIAGLPYGRYLDDYGGQHELGILIDTCERDKIEIDYYDRCRLVLALRSILTNDDDIRAFANYLISRI